MMYILPVFAIIIILGIRTMLWHVQNWQLREYRIDRIFAHFRTEDGQKDLLNLWFFRGILPRPKLSFRVLLILGVFLLLSALEIFALAHFVNLTISFIIWERTIFLLIGLSVIVSKIPVSLGQELLFLKARKIIEGAKNVTTIGITGSFGKSSTKEIMSHICEQKFGSENVLKNPENNNTEIAIARLILKNKEFFIETQKDNKIFICEIAAYKKGEIKKVCKFVQPDFGILTGVNSQHLELFGSQRNIVEAKFELAECCKEKVFFNADNGLLRDIFAEKSIPAEKVGVKKSETKILKTLSDKTEFKFSGQSMILNWPGEFFVSNALLCLNVFAELGGTSEEMRRYLNTIPPLNRALKIEDFKDGKVLKDLYSANPNGVMSAIKHLDRVSNPGSENLKNKSEPGFNSPLPQNKGKKIFVGIPLRELGDDAHKIHEQIFGSLRNINAEVFWMKEDFSELGKKICGDKFHGDNLGVLKDMITRFGKNDAVLLESRLQDSVLEMFSD